MFVCVEIRLVDGVLQKPIVSIDLLVHVAVPTHLLVTKLTSQAY